MHSCFCLGLSLRMRLFLAWFKVRSGLEMVVSDSIKPLTSFPRISYQSYGMISPDSELFWLMLDHLFRVLFPDPSRLASLSRLRLLRLVLASSQTRQAAQPGPFQHGGVPNLTEIEIGQQFVNDVESERNGC